ncbi:MAG: hypothetical protein ACODAU_11910 [Myxococcota bacterium]
MRSAAERAEALARRVRALQDADIRVAYVRHELGRMDPGTAADVVTVVSARAQAREDGHARLLLAISLALADPDTEPLRRAIVATAAARGQREVAALFAVRPEASADADDKAHEVPDFGSGRPLTLGERKALARRNDRRLIARVLRDPHPDVIRVLLGNPSLTEDDVVRLCARRPVRSEVLREVFRAPRWLARYRVRRALVRNPHCPRELALQLAPHLNAQDAREVSESPELHDEVRLACRRAAVGERVH